MRENGMMINTMKTEIMEFRRDNLELNITMREEKKNKASEKLPVLDLAFNRENKQEEEINNKITIYNNMRALYSILKDTHVLINVK